MNPQRRRDPVWSQFLTQPMARAIPESWHAITLWLIKAFHTLIFASIGSTIVLFVWDGLRGRPRRRTAYALGVGLAEGVIYLSNNQVCPLTPLAEEFGAASGGVVDIFLPDALARRIPVISTTALVLGAALNLRALRRAA